MKKIIRKNIWLIATVLTILAFLISVYTVSTERSKEHLVVPMSALIIIAILSIAWNVYYSNYLKKKQNDEKNQLGNKLVKEKEDVVKSFIERLTDEQVKIFLDRHYPKEERYSYGFDKTKDSVYVRMDRSHGDNSFNFSLEEFDTIGCNCHPQWINYLYEVFGEEYKQAYLDRCAKIFR